FALHLTGQYTALTGMTRERCSGIGGSSMGCQSQQLADGSGISIWTLRGYEKTRREPNWKAALKVAKALGVTLEAFADCISLHDDDAHPNARQPKFSRPSRRQAKKAGK